MTNYDIKDLLKKIDDLDDLDSLETIVDMMKEIIVEDDNMNMDNKKKFLFLYLQYKSGFAKYVTKSTGISRKRFKVIKKFKDLFR